MAGRRTSNGPLRERRRTAPGLEGLESREVLANASPLGPFLPPLGPFLPPGTTGPQNVHGGLTVDAHRALNKAIRPVFGPGTGEVVRSAEVKGAAANSRVAQQVLSVPLIHQLFSREDVYRLLRSEGVAAAYTVGARGERQLTGTVTIISPPSIIGEPILGQRVVTITGGGGVGVTIAIDDTVPVLELGNGVRRIVLDVEDLPPEAIAILLRGSQTGGQTFSSIGADLLAGLETARPVEAPKSAPNVPGLRLSSYLSKNQPFPSLAKVPFGKFIRIASARRLFDLNPQQERLLNQRIQGFYNTVENLYEGGGFTTPDAPAVDLPSGPLEGTLQVSFGALKEVFIDPRGELDGQAKVSGLDLARIQNMIGTGDQADILGFPGRFDAGFVFDEDGYFGVYLSVRNVMTNTIPGLQEANKIFGEVAVEVSNASKITDLSGLRNVEALSLGSALSGSLLASDGNGIKSFAGSVGYGAGLEFGTGARYTEIIPLGNVLASPLR